jgi:mannosyltransferase OCH1-like enzyme
MIFSFWTDRGQAGRQVRPLDGFSNWKSRFPDYTVFSDQDVIPLLGQWGDDATSIFQDIRIPACKADLGRLVLLYNYGGLYVDAHCAPGPDDQLAAVLARLAQFDLVLFDESFYEEEYRHTWILNGVLAARAGAPVLARIIDRALTNLRNHKQAERLSSKGLVEYDIYKLTGPWIIWHEIFNRCQITGGGEFKPEYKDLVSIWPFVASKQEQPVIVHHYNEYRKPLEVHWSRRQQKEPLFANDANMQTD